MRIVAAPSGRSAKCPHFRSTERDATRTGCGVSQTLREKKKGIQKRKIEEKKLVKASVSAGRPN
jgi:hypothetical protein